MNSKYYRPEISDFYVGYEYEYKTHDGAVHTKEYMDNLPWLKSNARDWVDITAYINRTLNGRMGNDPGLQDIETIRVKYLDRQDVESLGWEYDEDSIRQLPLLRFVKYENGRVCNALWLDEDEHTIDIIQNNFNGGGGYFSIFKGDCKSINELRKIVSWLKI